MDKREQLKERLARKEMYAKVHPKMDWDEALIDDILELFKDTRLEQAVELVRIKRVVDICDLSCSAGRLLQELYNIIDPPPENEDPEKLAELAFEKTIEEYMNQSAFAIKPSYWLKDRFKAHLKRLKEEKK